MFTKETYIKRREHLRETMQSGLLLFQGNDESPMNYADNTYHFHQDSTFLYYFGINKPGLHAVMDIDAGVDYIFGDDLTIDHIVWMGHQPTINELAAGTGITKTGNLQQLSVMLINNKTRVQYLPPYRADHKINFLHWLGISPGEAAQNASIQMIRAIGEQRIIKSKEEIIEIEKAVNTTVEMHQAAMRFARPGMTEAQVMAKVYEKAHAAGGNISFPIIATINGQTLHNHYHGNTIKEGDLFLLDAGAETATGYAGDMSSTFPVSRTFSSAQKEIYQLTLDAHNAAIDACLPGTNYRDVHLKAARVITDGMKAMGFMKGNTDDAVEAGAHALFFPCGTGHLMGLDVHDMENFGEQWVGYAGNPKSTLFGLKSLRLARPLQKGYVITIEPGIYFIPQLIDLWKKDGKLTDFINYNKVEEYRDFGGIRNEEDVLITETGNRILGKPLAKSIEDVEKERILAFEV
jgi:Xaa-Pro aminopeptidase